MAQNTFSETKAPFTGTRSYLNIFNGFFSIVITALY